MSGTDSMSKSPRVVIGVLTAAAYQKRRDGVMATWGRDAVAHPHADLVFLIGDAQTKLPRREGNILYLPCPDDYDSLPQKTRWFCLWALAHGGQWDRLLKCDDDTYVQVDRLVDGKWEMPIVGCKDGNGDHFHGGAGYLISREAALAIASYLTSPTGLEDWKARDAVAHCGMWFEHDDRFCFDKRRMPMPSNEQITCHYASPVRMRLIHDSFFRAAADAEITIPQTIHHIWLGGGTIPDRLVSFRDSWAERHPGWEMKLWTEENLPPLVNQELFERASTPAQKCHIARYEILHREGGVYVDFDVECRRPIDDLLYGVHGFAAAEDDDFAGIAVLAASAGDTLLSQVIEKLPESFASGSNPSTQTGAWAFTPHLLRDTTWKLGWWGTFYPVHYSRQSLAPIDSAYGIHHWEASWQR